MHFSTCLHSIYSLHTALLHLIVNDLHICLAHVILQHCHLMTQLD